MDRVGVLAASSHRGVVRARDCWPSRSSRGGCTISTIPFLRAQGAWTPWGYYLDICFELLVGAGLVLLVLDDLGRGVRALSALSGDLQRRDAKAEPMDLLLSRPLTLPGVRGSAMFMFDGRTPPVAASCAVRAVVPTWQDVPPQAAVADALARMRLARRPQVVAASAATLSVHRGAARHGVEAPRRRAGDGRRCAQSVHRADDDFLLALGQQVGAALEQFELDRNSPSARTALERLSARMVRQHEDERRRLSRELHDETAQVFSAVKMQLEALRSSLVPTASARLDRLLGLVDQGIASIRQVTSDLRPSLLDDLGLVPALRSLVTDFNDRSGLRATLDCARHAAAAAARMPTWRSFGRCRRRCRTWPRHAGGQVVARHADGG